jgi:hypothetical protein
MPLYELFCIAVHDATNFVSSPVAGIPTFSDGTRVTAQPVKLDEQRFDADPLCWRCRTHYAQLGCEPDAADADEAESAVPYSWRVSASSYLYMPSCSGLAEPCDCADISQQSIQHPVRHIPCCPRETERDYAVRPYGHSVSRTSCCSV